MTESKPTTASQPIDIEAQRSLWSDAWRSLQRNPYFFVGAALSIFFTLMAIYPPLFTGGKVADTNDCHLENSRGAPSASAPFGYDMLGCDLSVFVPHGARVSMSIALIVVLIVALVSIILGALAGYLGGAVDSVVSRLAEIFYAVPMVLGAMLMLTTLFSGERDVLQVAVPLVVFGWMTPARLVRSAVLSVREADYVSAGRSLGAGTGRILGWHVLPNTMAPLIVFLTIMFGQIIAAEAALSFLGIGMTAPSVSWGLQISQAQDMFSQGQSTHMLFFPALFVSLAVLGFVLMGDALRDALDPKSR